MSDEDRVVSAENDGEAFEETARDGTSFRLRLVAHDQHAYDWYYNVVANPMLWFLQHHLWGLAYEPVIDHGLHHAWSEGYVAVNRAFADAVWTSSIATRMRRSSSTTTTCTSRRAWSETRGPRRGSCTSCTSRGRDRQLVGAAGRDPARDPRRPARERRRRLPHAPLAPELHARRRGHRRRGARLDARRARLRGAARRRYRGADLRRHRGVRRARAEPGGARGRREARARSGRRS